MNSRNVAARCLGIAPGNIHLVSPFVGGGFGSKGFAWYHPILAAMAARAVRPPVKLALTRRQVFSLSGHRPRTIQRVAPGATKDGTLTSLRHETLTQTSTTDEFVEPAGITSAMLYAVPNLKCRTGSPA